MAERVSGHQFRGRGRRVKYPWDEWLDGSTWQITPGEDFACIAESFRRVAGAAARRQGGHARTSIENGSFFLQFVRDGE
jgi:hypothetical protein